MLPKTMRSLRLNLVFDLAREPCALVPEVFLIAQSDVRNPDPIKAILSVVSRFFFRFDCKRRLLIGKVNNHRAEILQAD